VLGENVLAEHTAAFANVELMGPVACGDEFIFGQAPAVHLLADVLGDIGFIREVVEQALCPGEVVVPDFPAASVGGFGILPGAADDIGGDARGVDVGLGVRHERNAEEIADLGVTAEGLQVVGGEGVPARVIAIRPGQREAVCGIGGQTQAEAIGLELAVGFAEVDEGIFGDDIGGEFAIGPEGRDGHARLMVSGQEILAAGVGFAVLAAGFASDGIGNPGSLHEVAFVGGVDEDGSFEGGAFCGAKAEDAVAILIHGFVLGDLLVQVDMDAGFLQPLVQDAFGDAGFEGPGGGLAVVAAGAFEELAGDAADQVFLAVHVGAAEPTGEHPADVTAGFDERDGDATGASGGNGGSRAARRAAIDEDIEPLPAEQRGRDQEEDRRSWLEHETSI
jgi:hypothetical protein